QHPGTCGRLEHMSWTGFYETPGEIARIGFEYERNQQTVVDFGNRSGECFVAGHLWLLPNKGRGRLLPPRDQIVESIEVGRNADSNPRDDAPDNNSVPHMMPFFPRRLDRADVRGIEMRRVACNSAAVCRNSALSSRESTRSASITALTIQSASISSKRGSRQCQLMRCSFTMMAGITPRQSGSAPYRRALRARSRWPPIGWARLAELGTTARRAPARPGASGPLRSEGRP